MNKLTRRSLMQAAGLAVLPWGIAAETGGSARTLPWRNWSGAQSCQPRGRYSPANEAQMAEFLGSTKGAIRPVGSGHSFSPLVPTDGHLVVIDQLSGLLEYNDATQEATFGAGTQLASVGPALLQKDRALQNLPDIDRQTIAGAIATGTHGTGLGLGCLSDEVSKIRLITPDGETVELSETANADLFNAARVSLGALGIVTQVTFKTRERYRLKAVNDVQSLDEALDTFVERAKSHRHYELFPFVHSDYSMTLAIDETDAPINNPSESPEQESSFTALLGQLEKMPIGERKTMLNSVVSQMTPTSAVDESHSILTNVRNDRFNEMEYSVELDAGVECTREILRTIESEKIEVSFPLEIRTVKGDDAWLSMSNGTGAHVAISIHRQAGLDYTPYFDRIERIFWKYGGRPHWGKLHSLDERALTKLYPRYRDFQDMRASLDPTGRMLNAHLKTLFTS